MSDLIESIPGKVSGVPLVKGTRIPVQALVDNADAGLSSAEIADLYEGLDAETVQAVLAKVRSATHPA